MAANALHFTRSATTVLAIETQGPNWLIGLMVDAPTASWKDSYMSSQTPAPTFLQSSTSLPPPAVPLHEVPNTPRRLGRCIPLPDVDSLRVGTTHELVPAFENISNFNDDALEPSLLETSNPKHINTSRVLSYMQREDRLDRRAALKLRGSASFQPVTVRTNSTSEGRRLQQNQRKGRDSKENAQ